MPSIGDYLRHLAGAATRAHLPPDQDARLIDYGHLRDGVLYHGTVSNFDGAPRSTWTFGRGRPVRQEQPLDDAAFESLWEGTRLPVFGRVVAAGASAAELDPVRYHVIGVVSRQGGQWSQRLYLIEADEADPDFLRWLAALNVPQGSA